MRGERVALLYPLDVRTLLVRRERVALLYPLDVRTLLVRRERVALLYPLDVRTLLVRGERVVEKREERMLKTGGGGRGQVGVRTLLVVRK